MHIYSFVFIKISIWWFLLAMVQDIPKYFFKMVYTSSPIKIFNTANGLQFWNK